MVFKTYHELLMQVINESLRLGNVSLGLLRRTLKDIQINGTYICCFRFDYYIIVDPGSKLKVIKRKYGYTRMLA